MSCHSRGETWWLPVGVGLGGLGLAGAVWAQAGEASADPSFVERLFASPIFTLFAVVTAGLLLGRIKVAGLSLGASGVLFTALAAGHFQLTLPVGVGTVGLVLFVYCVGLGAGPTFFDVFLRQGKQLAILSVVIVAAGAAATYGVARLLAIPYDLAGGILAGALTSTPGLAAGIEAVGKDSNVAIGFGIAYPLGVVGVVLFVQLLPRLLGVDLDGLARRLETSRRDKREIVRVLVEIANPAVFEKRPEQVPFLENANAAITRILEGERLIPIGHNFVLRPGEHVIVIADANIVDSVVDFLGKRSDRPFTMDADHERRSVIVTAAAMLDRPLHELRLLKTYGVTISRVTRQDVPFVPTAGTTLQNADVLTVVGGQSSLAAFADAAGHSPKAIEMTDVISLALGIAFGAALGLIPIPLPGGAHFALGLAGGPLLVALVLAHFGKIGPVVGYMPRPSRLLLTDVGLVFFLASAGIQAGASFMPVLREYGVVLILAGAVVTVAPMAIAYFVARFIFKLNLLEVLGGVCGGMTSTPGLGAITAKTDSQAPVIGYAAAYPVALILMTVATQAVLAALRV